MAFDNYELIQYKDKILLLDLDRLTLNLLECTSEEIEFLLNNTDIDKKSNEFTTKAEKLYQLQKEEFKLDKICIVPTYSCNFSCIYCYQQTLPIRQENRAMSPEYIDRIFDICDEMDKSEDFSIHISGGEPLLLENMDLMRYLLEKIAQHGYKTYLTTNGFNLAEFAPMLLDYSNIIREVKISLDGGHQSKRRRLKSGESYTVDQIIRGIKSIATQINVTCNTGIDAENADQIHEILNFLKQELIEPNLVSRIRIEAIGQYLSDYKHDIRSSFFEQMKMIMDLIETWDEEDQKKITIENRACEKLSKIVDAAISEDAEMVYPAPGCTSKRQLLFDPYGDIYLCELLAGIETGKLGTFYPELSFNEAYYKLQNRDIFNLEKCQSCKYAFLCGGGCPGNALAEHDDLFKEDCLSFEGDHKEGLFHTFLPYLMEKKLKLGS